MRTIYKKLLIFLSLVVLTGCGNPQATKLPTGSSAKNNNQIEIHFLLTYHTSSELKDPSVNDHNKTYSAKLPLYPNAAQSSSYIVYKSTPMIAPLYTASKKFTIPTDLNHAMNWYKDTLKKKDYVTSMQGSDNSGYHFITESYKTQNSDQGLSVDLGFKKISDHKTFISYFVKYIPTLQRPASSLLKGTLTKVVIVQRKGQKIIHSHTYTNATQIHSIVQTMNGLERAHPAMEGCAMDDGTRYDFHFYTNHKDEKAIFNPSCNRVTYNKIILKSDPALIRLVQ